MASYDVSWSQWVDINPLGWFSYHLSFVWWSHRRNGFLAQRASCANKNILISDISIFTTIRRSLQREHLLTYVYHLQPPVLWDVKCGGRVCVVSEASLVLPSCQRCGSSQSAAGLLVELNMKRTQPKMFLKPVSTWRPFCHTWRFPLY